MLFENGYETFLRAHDELGQADASIGVKIVEEPQHYGVAEITEGTRVERLVEKPDDPQSNYATIGVYIVENTDLLLDSLSYLVENDIHGAGDEYQLTDALQRMIEQDAHLDVFEVEDWYDCGRPETLLEANRVLLSKEDTDGTGALDNAIAIPPVDLGEGVVVDESVVGPYVSAGDDATISDSIVQNGIIGQNASLNGVNLAKSIVGDNASVHGEVTN